MVIKNVSSEIIALQRPKSLNKVVYESLKESILTGKLMVGEVYSELELARKFGISRTPVREALLRLSAENLIGFHPRKGFSVNFFNKKDIENLYELREAIEEVTILKIANNLSNKQIQTIQQLISEQKKCIKNNFNEDLFLEIDRRFHLLIIEATGNRFFVQTYNSIRDYMVISAKNGLRRKGRALEVVQEHKAILKGLIQRNERMINKALKKHLLNSKLAAYDNAQP